MHLSLITKYLLLLLLPFMLCCKKNIVKDKSDGDGDGGGDGSGPLPPTEYVGGQYFVDPNGSDSNDGTVEKPWKTWAKAFKTAEAGDTVYFREGIYESTSGNNGERDFNSGTVDKPICFFNYPGEKPVLDCSNRDMTLGYNKGITIWHQKNIHFKGLEVQNLFQRMDAHVVGIEAWDVANVTFENMTVHHVAGEAFLVADFHGTVKYINCDAYSLCDSLQSAVYPTPGSPGQNGAGFHFRNYNATDGATDSKLIYYGCRAWEFSDNGFAGTSVGYVEWDQCWAFDGGALSGEGCGFKYASTYRDDNKLQQARLIKNCIGANNAAYGFSPNNAGDSPLVGKYYNNTAYYNGHKDGLGHGLGYGWIIMQTNPPYPPPTGEIYTNNLSYDNHKADFHRVRTQQTNDDNNNWNYGLNLSDSDFESVDWSELKLPRKEDGSLPDINFMKPRSGSSLIDKGVQVDGIKFKGAAPDLGAFEIE
jgi:uncharacterized protein YqfB (UPF0267 family)